MAAAYRLSHWRHIDVFVYFSHHLVTIPPVGWIQAAHLHGVKVRVLHANVPNARWECHFLH